MNAKYDAYVEMMARDHPTWPVKTIREWELRRAAKKRHKKARRIPTVEESILAAEASLAELKDGVPAGEYGGNADGRDLLHAAGLV